MLVAQLLSRDHSSKLPKVTSLDPRTPHQPEKLQKLSKNNCVLHPVFFWSIEKMNLYVLSIQLSAARSQGSAARVVHNLIPFFAPDARWARISRDL